MVSPLLHNDGVVIRMPKKDLPDDYPKFLTRYINMKQPLEYSSPPKKKHFSCPRSRVDRALQVLRYYRAILCNLPTKKSYAEKDI